MPAWRRNSLAFRLATARLGFVEVDMTEQIPPILRPFVAEKVVLLQTRKRDGTWVDTPVNVAVEGARAYFRTPARAAKNKRIRNFHDVRFAPCTWRGRRTGAPVEATARLLAGEESAAAGRLINRKYPVLQRILIPFIHRLLRTETLHYELTGTRELRRD
jgi:PPOX class probable F420-dependent enzyme